MKSKFSSLDELVKEIDNAILTLQNKKKLLLKAASDNGLETQYDGLVDKVNEYGSSQKDSGFKNYTASIYRDNYDLLSKAAFKADMTISSFLKKTCLIDLQNDQELYFKDHHKIEEFLEERNARGRNVDRKTIGLSIKTKDPNAKPNDKDEFSSEDFEKLATSYGMKSPKELVRFLVDMFLYKHLAKTANDFGLSKLPFNKCKSSHIQGYAYDLKEKHLFVKFINGPVYMYKNVDKDVYKGMCDAQSKGKYFNEYILGAKVKYDFIKFYVEE